MIVNHIHKKWYFLRSQILPLTPTGHTSSWKCKILYYIEPNLTQNVGVHFSICGGGEGGRLAPESNRNFFKCDIFEINHKEIILQEKLKMFNIMGWIPFKGWNTSLIYFSKSSNEKYPDILNFSVFRIHIILIWIRIRIRGNFWFCESDFPY